MGKKKTHEEYVQQVAEINPNIEVLEVYQGNGIHILHRCKICENEWYAKPNNILNGTGCRKCYVNKRKKTQLQYTMEVKQINPNIEVIGEYINEYTNIPHLCKVCGNIWSPKPMKILLGQGCPRCARARTHSEYVQEISLHNSDIEVIENYQGVQTNIKHQCKICGHIWEPKPLSILRGSGCPKCNRTNKVSNTELKIYYYLKKYFSDAISGYSDKENGISELDIYIPSLRFAIEYDGEFYHQNIERDKYKDQICKNLNINLTRVREPGCPEYKSSCDFIFLQNHSQNELETIITYILETIGIEKPEVDFDKDIENINSLVVYKRRENSLAENFPDIAKEWHIVKNGNLTPENVGYASSTKVWWKCQRCGHEWLTRVYNRTISKSGCPQCSNEKIKKSKRKPVYCLELNQIFKSVTKAEMEVGVNCSNIIACCSGKYNYAGKNKNGEKLHWYYLYDKIKEDNAIIQGALTLGLVAQQQYNDYLHSV